MRVLAAGSNNGPRLTPPSTRFHTIVGQPQTIALKYPTGKPTRTGNVMYTLTSGVVAFFPPHVAQAIDSLTLAPGQPLTVCHLGGDEWDIERAAIPAQEAAHPPPSREPASSAPSSDAAHPTPAPEPTTKLEYALKTAITAAQNAERYAAELGYQVRFDADMITRQALTVLINMEGGRK